MSDLYKHNKQLVESFINAYSSLKRLMQRISSGSHEDKMATLLQYQALSFLAEHKQTTVGELATNLDMSSSAVAQLIDRLILAGRIIRKNDASDRRIAHISLTQNGKKELLRIRKMHIEKMSYILSHIPEKDLKELIRIQTEMITKLAETL
jgi:DNA-binding MarR family transcriptional regulator